MGQDGFSGQSRRTVEQPRQRNLWVTDVFEWRPEVGLEGALSVFARAGSDAADATFVRSAQTPLRMRS